MLIMKSSTIISISCLVPLQIWPQTQPQILVPIELIVSMCPSFNKGRDGGFKILACLNYTSSFLLPFWVRLPAVTIGVSSHILLFWTYVSITRSTMNGLQALTYWKTGTYWSHVLSVRYLIVEDFNNPSGSRQGLLNAIQSVGSVCSLPIAPNLADWIDRKCSIFIGSFVVALGAGLQSGATDTGMFIAGRFFSKSFRTPFRSSP